MSGLPGVTAHVPQTNIVFVDLAPEKAAGVVDSRREGGWVYYRLAPQGQPEVQAVLDELVRGVGGRRGLKSELVRIKKRTGPGACD